MLDKLPKMPLGEIINVPSGNLKQIMVDQVESMEKPLAHLLPEMTSNILGSLSIFIYLLLPNTKNPPAGSMKNTIG